MGAGAWFGSGGEFPLAALEGDLLAPARLTVAYGVARGVVLEVRGDVWRVLDIDRRGTSRVPLDRDVEDGTTTDHGDLRVGAVMTLAGDREGFAGGLRLEMKVPSSDEEKGIGTNTTDLRAGLLATWGGGPWRFTGDAGIGILEAPLESFEQNDVVVYSGELLYRPADGPLRLFLGVDGRASTRDRVPVGTEDLGEFRAGAEWRFGEWLVDGGLAAGYAGTSPDWGLAAGIAWLVGG